MIKIIKEIEKEFEKRYLKDKVEYETIKVKSIVIEIISIKDNTKIIKNLTIENHM